MLCLGGLNAHDDAIRRWKDKVSTLQMYNTFRSLQGLDGEPIEFEWKIPPGFSALQLLHTIQNDLEGKCINPEEFSDRIIFMSMFDHIDLEKKGNEDTCALTSGTIRDYASKFKDGHYVKIRYDDYESKFEGKWDLRASKMLDDFENSGQSSI